jgi:hypothetical protein
LNFHPLGSFRGISVNQQILFLSQSIIKPSGAYA